MAELDYMAPSIWHKVEGVAGAAARGVASPLKFALSPVSALKQRKRVNLTKRQYRNRISFETEVRSPRIERLAEARELICELAHDADWISLGELFEEWDQHRVSCPSKQRLVQVGLEELCAIHRASDSSGAGTFDPQASIYALDRAATKHPELYVLNGIRAHFHLDDAAQSEDQAVAGEAMEVAGQLLADMDATQLKSSLVAAAKLRHAIQAGADGEQVAQYYTDCVMLDPHDQLSHAAFGVYLLPANAGSYELLEIEARNAAASTSTQTGQAAYASMYLSVLQSDPLALVHLDTELFGEGAKDLVKYRGTDPAFIAEFTQTLRTIAQGLPHVGRSPELKAELLSKSKLLNRLVHRILRDNLRAIHVESWQDGLQGALEMISDACQRDLAKGAHLKLEQTGLVAYHPIT